jgi:hypothetical protein
MNGGTADLGLGPTLGVVLVIVALVVAVGVWAIIRGRRGN